MAARAPGQAGTKLRGTKVLRRPYWVEWGNDGAGEVKLIPSDRTHNVMVEDADGVTTPYYQSKGFIPLNMLAADHKAHSMFKALCERAVASAKKDGLPPPEWVPPSLSR